MDSNTIISAIKNDGLLPLFYNDDPAVCISLCKALYNAGVSCIEFTNRGAHAVANFKAIIAERNQSMPGLLVGIGTIRTAGEAEVFIQAEADFLVSPFYDEGVSNTAREAGIAWIPGCMTPREIHLAQQGGWAMVKLFPGNTLGTGFVEAVKPLFNGMDFIVTGGVETDADNIKGWFKSGVAGVGMGSKLITKEIVSGTDHSGLTTATVNILNIIKNSR